MASYLGSTAPATSYRNGGACSACNRADRLVDINVMIEYEGWVTLCAPCVADAARCIVGVSVRGDAGPGYQVPESPVVEEMPPVTSVVEEMPPVTYTLPQVSGDSPVAAAVRSARRRGAR